MTPASCTPSVWGEAGTETITFHFTGTDVTCEVEGEALEPVVTITSLTITGTPPTQHVGDEEDYTGCTFTFGLNNGQSIVKTWTEILNSWINPPEIAVNDAIDELLDPDNGYVYLPSAVGTHTVTWWPEESYWEIEGYAVAIPAPTATTQITVEAAPATREVTGVTITGNWPTQSYMQQIDWTGMSFSFTMDSGEPVVLTAAQAMDQSHPAVHLDIYDIDEQGRLIHPGCGMFYNIENGEGNYWTENGYTIVDPLPSAQYTGFPVEVGTLESLSVQPSSYTEPQYTGEGTDAEELRFTATYSSGATDEFGIDHVVCSPVTWDASGNPNNLGTQNVMFSYTKDNVTANTGINGTVIHRPDTQSIAHDTNGHVYFDFDEHYVNSSGGTTSAPLGAMDLLQSGGSQGEWAVAFFDAASYTNDTTVDGTALTGWIGDYGLVVQESGTINTDGFIPQTGYSYYGIDHLDQCYISWSQDGTNASTTGNVYIIAAPLANNISAGGYKKTDFDTTAQYAKVYTVSIT